MAGGGQFETMFSDISRTFKRVHIQFLNLSTVKIRLLNPIHGGGQFDTTISDISRTFKRVQIQF